MPDPIEPDLLDLQQQTLPADFFPACWHNDDARMSVLFAPFRSKSLNPINYDTKLLFWTQLIGRYCDHKGSANCTLAELRTVFRRANRAPHSLHTVLHEMRTAGQTLALATFLEAPAHTWRQWAQRRIGAAIAWPVQRVAASLWPSAQQQKSPSTGIGHQSPVASPTPDVGADIDALAPLIVLDAVQRHAQQLQRNEAVAGRVLDMQTLVQLVQQTQLNQPPGTAARLSAAGIRLAVHHLHCAQLAAVSIRPAADGVGQLQLVKIGRATSDGDAKPDAVVITETECSVFAVQQAVRQQQALIDQLGVEHEAADRQARQLVHEKKSALAKVQLRKRKQLEHKIEKESEKLLNLETMLASIEDSRHSANVVGAYKLAASALRQTHTEAGITVDSVHDALDDVKEVLEDHNEIQQALGDRQMVDGLAAADDDVDLERELADLLALDDAAEEERKDRELNASIERRLKQLNIEGFADLSIEEQQRTLEMSGEVQRSEVAEAAQ